MITKEDLKNYESYLESNKEENKLKLVPYLKEVKWFSGVCEVSKDITRPNKDMSANYGYLHKFYERLLAHLPKEVYYILDTGEKIYIEEHEKGGISFYHTLINTKSHYYTPQLCGTLYLDLGN